MLRERLEKRGNGGVVEVVKGAGLYLALAKLEALLRGHVAAEDFNVSMAATSAPTGLAFVSDFTVEDRSELKSELFTASVVGGMLVGLGRSEGVIVDDDVLGLGVRLQSNCSATLAGMVKSFLQCLDTAALLVMGAPAGGSASGELALAE
jgi:hypothetical protein